MCKITWLIAIVVAAFGTLSADARQFVVPPQPVSPYADTEVSTNVVLLGSRTDVREVKLHLQIHGTPTNDLEVAFGNDVNTNGVLDVEEAETVYGWRGGRYFIENVLAWDRFEVEAAANAQCGVIDIQVQNDKDFVPKSSTATCGGEPAFESLLVDSPPSWLFNSSWKLARVVRRSAGVSEEWISCDVGYDYFVIRLR